MPPASVFLIFVLAVFDIEFANDINKKKLAT
jgi:hypothetical protein